MIEKIGRTNLSPSRRHARTSAIIINYNSGPDLSRCLESLAAQDVPLELIVVDNASSDGSAEEASIRFPQVRVVKPSGNLGFAGGVNEGAKHASGEYLLFLNPDTVLTPESVRLLEEAMDSDYTVGVCAPVLHIGQSRVIEYGSTLDFLGSPVGLTSPGAPLYVQGCALATRASIFRDLRGFDHTFFMIAEDADYCWRVLLHGFDVITVMGAKCFHEGAGSTPGGYISEGILSTTPFRVQLRERNTLLMLMKCSPARHLAWQIPAYLFQSLATACLLLLTKRLSLAAAFLRGVAEAVWVAPRTLRDRRFARSSSTRINDREAQRRLYRGFRRLLLLRRFGLPRPIAGEASSVQKRA